jgi:tetratricopeptide (TPR) repeat protein
MARATGNTQWLLLAERSAAESLQRLPLFNYSAILVQARVAEASHDFDRAIKLARSVVPEVPEARAVLVSSYLAQGKLEAETEAEQLVKTSPGLGSLMMRGLVRNARGKTDAARQDFELAIDREDVGEGASSARVRTFLGRLYAQTGNHQKAEQLYREALYISPRLPLAILSLADLSLRQGKYRQADRLYSSISNAPGSANTFDHSAQLGKAQVELLRGNQAKAQIYLVEAEKLLRAHQDVSSFGHRRELAKILLLQTNPQGWQEALNLMETEVKLRRDRETLDTYAWALIKQNQFTKAQQILNEIIATGVKDAAIYARASAVAETLNDRTKAQIYHDRMIAIDPTFNNQAQQLLGIK